MADHPDVIAARLRARVPALEARYRTQHLIYAESLAALSKAREALQGALDTIDRLRLVKSDER